MTDILLVDDQEELLRIYGTLLREAGYSVRTAADGAEAIARTRESCPQMVLMDIDMPELDGISALRQIKDDPELADIPVVLLTSDGHGDTVREGLQAGGAAYIIKPVDPTELLEELQLLFLSDDFPTPT